MPKHGGGNPNDKPNNFNLAVKKLMHYLNKYKFRIIFALIFSAFSSVLAIISPKRLEKLINIICLVQWSEETVKEYDFW